MIKGKKESHPKWKIVDVISYRANTYARKCTYRYYCSRLLQHSLQILNSNSFKAYASLKIDSTSISFQHPSKEAARNSNIGSRSILPNITTQFKDVLEVAENNCRSCLKFWLTQSIKRSWEGERERPYTETHMYRAVRVIPPLSSANMYAQNEVRILLMETHLRHITKSF